jgi:serine protease
MRSRFLPVAAAALTLALSAPLAPELHAQTSAPQTARVIVKFKPDAAVMRKQALTTRETHAARAKALGERMGLALEGGHGVGERIQVVTGVGVSSEALAAGLAQDSEVEYAVPSRRKRIVAAPSDPLYSASNAISPSAGQWYLRAPQAAAAADSMTVVSSIDAEAAWSITTGAPTVVVAVLDTGVRFEHPDLRKVADGGNYLDGYDMVSDLDIANDGDLRDADASDPGDWIDQADINSGKFSGACTANDIGDSSWHGTETSALIGAMTNNAIGMASVGRNVRILPVRVLGKCGGNDEDILAGMRWAAGISVPGLPVNANPAKVINMSLGGSGVCSVAYRDAIAEINARGTVVVVSAGNSTGHKVGEPANCPGAIGVSGLRNIGNKVGFSDIGPETSLSAPAGNCVNDNSGPCLFPILSARNTGLKGPVSSTYSTSTSSPSLGTSFSAPLVAGTAALMFSANPALTPQQVKLLLQSSARPFPASGGDPGASQCTAPQYDSSNTAIDQVQCYCNTGVCGAGMLDAGAAVTAATSGTATFARARIDPSPARALSGQAVTLSGANSDVLAGRSVTSYQWTLVDGGGIVTAISNPTARTASVVPSAAGTFTVRLTVTDSAQTSSSATMSILVATGPVVVTPPATPTSTDTGGGGGGGALSIEWLLALLAAIALLQHANRRRA